VEQHGEFTRDRDNRTLARPGPSSFYNTFTEATQIAVWASRQNVLSAFHK
jgi:hypothetical protein